MKEYIPFDIEYWKRQVSNSILAGIANQSKAISESALENIIEGRNIDNPLAVKPINKNSNNNSNNEIIKSNKSNNKKEDFLDTIIEERKEFLTREINKLDFFINRRNLMSCAIMGKINYDIAYNISLIYELDLWQKGYNSGVEKRRVHLEKLCGNLEQEKRQEITSCWRDIVGVTKDLRTLLREYVELIIRRRIIQNK